MVISYAYKILNLKDYPSTSIHLNVVFINLIIQFLFVITYRNNNRI